MTGRPAAETVARLHLAWATREPVVIELGVADRDLAEPEGTTEPPWQLGGGFTFLRERLHFLVWANSYDARRDPPVWWWGVKAEAAGAAPGGTADVLLPDGRAAWVDGGPRGADLGVSEPIIHAESVALGRLTEIRHGTGALAGLAPDQRAAAGHGAGPARIIAPAGSGKTRTLTARVAHLIDDLGFEPELVTAVAYNNRAAAEMRERLAGDSGATVRTIHSLGWAILREARRGVALLDEREVRSRLDPLVPVRRRANADVVGPYVEALAEVRIALRDPAAVEADRDDAPDFARVYRRYRERLLARGEADFDEQVYGAVEALLADLELRRRWQATCRHMLVDEFQDLTPAYLLLIRLLASPQLDVFGVGDDDQTIYGYLGADPGYLIDYPDLFPGAGRHDLVVNYRCPVPVVEAAGHLLTYNRRRLAKDVRPGPEAEVARGSLRVARSSGSELAAAAAGAVGELAADAGPGNVAVLARVNSALLPVHAALAEAGVPFRSPLGHELLRRTVLAAALAWLRIGLEPDAIRRADVLAAVRRPARGLNRVANEIVPRRGPFTIADVGGHGKGLDGRQAGRWHDFVADLRQVADAAKAGDVGRVLDVVVDRVGLSSAALALDGRRTRVDRAAQSDDLAAIRRTAAIHPDLASFEPWLRAVLETPADPGGVTLSTVHRVKGMEWDRIVLFGADRGLLPHALATDWEEERRVFHVAITRARRSVLVLADAGRPSPFLDELTGRAAAPAAKPEARPAAPQPALVDASGDADPELVRQLKEWRLATARERGVPAYVVLHDATIDAIAAVKPQDERMLAAVPGIGPAKLEAYGDDLLALCAAQ